MPSAGRALPGYCELRECGRPAAVQLLKLDTAGHAGALPVLDLGSDVLSGVPGLGLGVLVSPVRVITGICLAVSAWLPPPPHRSATLLKGKRVAMLFLM